MRTIPSDPDVTVTPRSRVTQFFEVVLPRALAVCPPQPHAGACVFDVGGEGGEQWSIDLTVSPPRTVPVELPDWRCRVRVSADDLLALLEDVRSTQTLVWQGRLQLEGDSRLLGQVLSAVRGSKGSVNPDYDGYYTALARLLPSGEFDFMNHGYRAGESDLDGGDGRSPWACAVALVERVTAGLAAEGKDLVDVGCGRGGPLSHLARRHRPRHAIGVDANPDTVALCRRNQVHEALGFLVADACALPLADRSFDIGVSIESSHCYGDRRVFLAELARVVRPGGVICYADVFHPVEGVEVGAWLAAAPRLRVDEHDDLTEGVARAVAANGVAFAGALASMADITLGNLAIITHLIREENEVFRSRFEARDLHYLSWRLTVEEDPHVDQ